MKSIEIKQIGNAYLVRHWHQANIQEYAFTTWDEVLDHLRDFPLPGVVAAIMIGDTIL